MKKSTHRITLLFVVLLLSVSQTSCGKFDKMEFNCIPPYENYSYPLNQWTASKPTPTLNPIHSNWKAQLEKPEDGLGYQIIKGENANLWIAGTSESQSVYQYDIAKKSLKRFQIEWQNQSYMPLMLYRSKNNVVWGYGTSARGATPILSKYNAEKNIFEAVIDSRELLLLEGSREVDLVEDSLGNLWILIPGAGLYIYNPESGYAEQKLPVPITDGNVFVNLGNEIALAQDDGIWINTQPKGETSAVVYYESKSNKTSVIAIPPGDLHNQGLHLFIDSKSNLWVNDYAYWPTQNTEYIEDYVGWNIVFRSNVFVTQRNPFHDYDWMRPKIILEDSQKDLWFSSFGLVRFHPLRGEWCRVIEDDSPAGMWVVEDGKSNFWTVQNGQIYKHD